MAARNIHNDTTELVFCLFHINHTACKVYKITKCHCKQLSDTTVSSKVC